MKQSLLLFFILIISCCSRKSTESNEQTNDLTDIENSVNVNSFPKNNQLYPRGSNNKAFINVVGTADSSVDSLITKVHRTNGVISRNAIKGQNNFSINLEIDALLHNYTIELLAKSVSGVEVLIKSASNVTAGDVYVINGQSNAWAIDYDNQYNNQDLPNSAQWVRTVGAMHVYHQTAISPYAENTDWFVASGKAPDIRGGVQLVGNGMVGVLGMCLGINLVESENVPIAIINGAGGGGAISYYQKSGNNDLDVPYGRLQNRIEASGLKDDIKAFIWNQGENNAGDSTADYKAALNQLYNSFVSDFTFDKFYVIQTSPGCNSSSGHQTIREAQRQFVEETDNTRILTRHGFSLNPNQSDGNYFLSDGCHYHAHGYEVLADWIYNLSEYDFYGNTINYEPPKVINVQLESSSSLTIEFDKEVEVQPDFLYNGVSYSAKEYLFAINGERTTSITDLVILPDNKKIQLIFSGQNILVGDVLTHILDDNYPSTTIPYQGPWIIDTATGVGVIGFTKNID